MAEQTYLNPSQKRWKDKKNIILRAKKLSSQRLILQKCYQRLEAIILNRGIIFSCTTYVHETTLIFNTCTQTVLIHIPIFKNTGSRCITLSLDICIQLQSEYLPSPLIVCHYKTDSLYPFIYPFNSPSPARNHQSVLCMCLLVLFVVFFKTRFVFFLLTHFTYYPQGPSMLLQMARFHSFKMAKY